MAKSKPAADIHISHKVNPIINTYTTNFLGLTLNSTLSWKTHICCILHGPGGECIMDVVPRGTELELQLRRGAGQAAHTCNNPHIKCT
jgi:hypothetical protein